MSVNQNNIITFQWLNSNILQPLEQQWKKRDFGNPTYNCTSYTIQYDFRNIITTGKIISVDDINQIKTNMDYLYDNYCKTHYYGHKQTQYSSQYTNNLSSHHVTYYYSQNVTQNSQHLYNYDNAIQTGYNSGYKSGVDSSHHLSYYQSAYNPHNSTNKTNVNSSKHITYQNSVDTGHKSSNHGTYYSQNKITYCGTHYVSHYSGHNSSYNSSDYIPHYSGHQSSNLSSNLSWYDSTVDQVVITPRDPGGGQSLECGNHHVAFT